MEQSNISSREKQLLQLGFKRNKHQRCFHQWKYDCSWIIDFWDLEELSDERWNIHIENYEFYLEKAKKELESEEKYLLGVESAEKRKGQQIKDLYNKYHSKLKEEQQPKLVKTVNKERILILSSKIDVLEELKTKIK